MANRQTRAYALRGKGTRANRMLGGGGPILIERPIFRGRCCDTSFANAGDTGNKRKHAHRYNPDLHMTLAIQHELLGLRRRAA